MEGINYLTFGFDQTAPVLPFVSDPSDCGEVFSINREGEGGRGELVELLPDVRNRHLNPAGEMLASRPSRKLLEPIDDERCPDLHIDIISNGTLFTEEEWNKFPGIHNKVNRFAFRSTPLARKRSRSCAASVATSPSWKYAVSKQVACSGTVQWLKFSFTYH